MWSGLGKININGEKKDKMKSKTKFHEWISIPPKKCKYKASRGTHFQILITTYCAKQILGLIYSLEVIFYNQNKIGCEYYEQEFL
jgi:hypothetical protein